MTLAIVAQLKAQPDKAAEFEAAFQKLQAIVKAEEPGCLLYALCRDKSAPGTYWVMEQYKDADARAAHGRSDAFKATAKAMAPVMAAAPIINECEMVE